MRLHSILLSTLIALSATRSVCQGQGADAPTPSEQTRRVELLRAEALERARRIRVELAEDGSPVELMESPLLRFGEPVRGNEDGSLWVWGRYGRPLVIAELYRNVGDKVKWIHVVSLTSSQLVTADTDAGRWGPREPQLKLKTVPAAPPPSERPVVRLREMKNLARRFEAHEFWKPGNTRYELRRLPSPVYRYADARTGLLDGAIFVFAHGTNPEIVMFVEAHKHDGKKSEWQLGFASLASAELHVTLNEQDFWELPRAPGVSGSPSDPYWLFSVNAPGAATRQEENANR